MREDYEPVIWFKSEMVKKMRDNYQPKYEWPSNCKTQWGGDGIVIKGWDFLGFMEGGMDSAKEVIETKTEKEKETERFYRTAFFEAFPRDPNTFIRGEGETIEDAEKSAWYQFQKVSACDHPEYDRRGYQNGAAFCATCGFFNPYYSEPVSTCCICGVNTYWTSDKQGRIYCEDHADQIPDKDKYFWQTEEYKRETEAFNAFMEIKRAIQEDVVSAKNKLANMEMEE